MHFADRQSAGKALAAMLQRSHGADSVVIALPRGGVPVAAEVARRLGARLDVRVVKKIGAPGQPELALGAVTADGETAWNPWLEGEVDPDRRARLRAEALEAARSREASIRAYWPKVSVAGREVLLVDDGVATGMTVLAALASLRREGAKRLVVAAPVMAPGVAQRLGEVADEVSSLSVPALFWAVGAHYEAFPQVEDAAVETILLASRRGGTPP